MRVLHVSQPTEAGVAGVVTALAAAQRDRGWQVAVACPGDGPLADAVRALGVPQLAWDAVRTPGRSVPAEARSLAGLVRDVCPDVVHLHSAKAGLAGRLGVHGRLPTLYQPHGWSFDAVHGAMRAAALRWERVAVRWADAVVCVSEDERARAEELRVRGHFEVLPNGVDLERFRPADAGARAAARARLGIGRGPLAVCVGRLARQKGQDVLLSAWPAVTSAVPDARLVLVGDGPDRPGLQARAGRATDFAGAVDDVRTWLAAADLVVVPSRWEGMSLSLLEAMAMARSVVATDVSGCREALGPTGAVVPVEDPGSLADAIVPRLRDRAAADEDGRQARRRVEERFDLARHVEAALALTAQVASRRRRTARAA